MFSFLKRKDAKKPGLAAIEIFPDGVAFAYCPNSANDSIDTAAIKSQEIKITKFYPFRSQPLQVLLTNIVNEHKLKGVNCNWVLHPNDFQLILTDKPNVNPEQYHLAVRWQVKDMVKIPVDNLVTSAFAPPDNILPYKNKLYVVAAQQSYLEHTVKVIQASFLNLTVIDIPELALRNLISLRSKEAVGCLILTKDESLLFFIADDSIEFIRSLRFGLASLQNADGTAVFISEIQRSLEYYQTRLKRPLPKEILIPAIAKQDKGLLDNLINDFKGTINLLELNSIITSKEPLSDETQALCTFAVGGALRRESTT